MKMKSRRRIGRDRAKRDPRKRLRDTDSQSVDTEGEGVDLEVARSLQEYDE